MSSDDVFRIEDEHQREHRASLTRHWDSLLLISVAWLLFEMFAEPALSIVVCAIKFGWKDFANAIWLWRKDSLASRGIAVAAFNVAAGLWRMTVGTLALIIVVIIINFVVIEAQGARPFKAQDAMLAGLTVMIILMCFVLSSVTTYCAMILAWWAKLRVWLDPTVVYSRKRKLWPPVPTGNNQLSRVVTTSLILLATGVIVISIVIIATMGRQGQAPGPLVFVPMIAIVLSALLILGGRERILNSLAADSPQECWSVSSTDRDSVTTDADEWDDDDRDYFDPNIVF